MSTVVLPLPVGDHPRSRPLPSISNPPIAGSSKKHSPFSLLQRSPPYEAPEPALSTLGASLASASSMFASTRVSLGSVLQEPRILANFLRYVMWHDFRSLALTCSRCRNVLQHPQLRDAVLSAFVPGYQYCLRYADLDAPGDINVQMRDLDHFLISQQLPLHRYPAHALATLSSTDMTPILELEERTKRYVALCQAHSRMVLLLQALIHSSLSPLPISEEPEDPSLRYRNTGQQGERELVFPAPLSFFSDNGIRRNHMIRQPTKKHARFFSMPSTFGRSPRTLEGEAPQRSRSRISILGKHKIPPPPPSAEPLGLKLYAGSWRGWRRGLTVSGSTSEGDETLFRRPNRHFASMTDSSRSSTDNSQGSPSPHPSRLAEIIPMPLTHTHTHTHTLTTHAPHDIHAATSRLRAPILRVYLPCSELDQGTISLCEDQLDDAGLWQNLSVGDVVCNLGYLPPEDRRGPESWMIFDGFGLVPYAPSDVLPLSDPFSLPSPLYYAHITTPPVNPRFIATLPHEEPELSLVLLPTRVRSPHSLNGFARIKKYMWLARLVPRRRPGFGEGWQCEWILEGEGTKEGRKSLLDALSGGDGDESSERERVKEKEKEKEWEWELIMEKSTTNRIWLRLISTTPPVAFSHVI